nr:HNH endonuclease [Paenibacillus vietnamensis]
MKPWARKFYNSKPWKQCRTVYIKKVHGLCERCPDPSKIVHHKVYLTPDNINHPIISLNHRLLEYVCQDCHNKVHHGSNEPVINEGLAFDHEGNLIQLNI